MGESIWQYVVSLIVVAGVFLVFKDGLYTWKNWRRIKNTGKVSKDDET